MLGAVHTHTHILKDGALYTHTYRISGVFYPGSFFDTPPPMPFAAGKVYPEDRGTDSALSHVGVSLEPPCSSHLASVVSATEALTVERCS